MKVTAERPRGIKTSDHHSLLAIWPTHGKPWYFLCPKRWKKCRCFAENHGAILWLFRTEDILTSPQFYLVLVALMLWKKSCETEAWRSFWGPASNVSWNANGGGEIPNPHLQVPSLSYLAAYEWFLWLSSLSAGRETFSKEGWVSVI
jgi:hypothetical protein